MRKKRVWRYYCDFCKKAGCSSYHMKRHERRCTMNPNRVCGMCEIVGEAQPDLSELIKLLPNPKEYEGTWSMDGDEWISYSGLDEAVAAALPALRDAANNCPACILAAIRQAGIPVLVAIGFDVKAEWQKFWDAYNESQHDYPDNYY